jgi:hypothetical protein
VAARFLSLNQRFDVGANSNDSGDSLLISGQSLFGYLSGYLNTNNYRSYSKISISFNSTIANKLMARMARIVIPDYPHHITQRGNRRQKTFFSADD